NTRRNFEVRASNDPAFASSVLLGRQGAEPHPFQRPWQINVTDARTFRYVRIRKTSVDADEYGQEYFNLSEVRVFSAENTPADALSGEKPIPVTDLRSGVVSAGQTLKFQLAAQDLCGAALRHRISELPANATFDATTATFSFTPAATQAGQTFQISIRSSDTVEEIVTTVDFSVAIAGAPRVTLLTPATTNRLTLGQKTLVTWQTNTDAAVTKFQIRLSTDGGVTYPTILGEAPGNARQFEWLVDGDKAALRKSQARLLVVAIDSLNRAGMDSTDRNLEIADLMAVTSAASFRPEALAPGAMATIFGPDLCRESGGAESLPLPTEIRGAHIDFIDSLGQLFRAPLFYVSPQQINFLIPEGAATGVATVTVFGSQGEISESQVSVQRAAPAIFTVNASGAGDAIVISTADGVRYESGAVRQNPATDVYVIVFGTGWRNSAISATTSDPAAGDRVTLDIDGQEFPWLYAGKQGEYVGLDQMNFKLPQAMTPGVHSLVIRVGQQISNTTTLRVY
ncbi:MAG: hypothetical protein ACKV2V_27360, partial [Blastocatellia bacterium]